MSEKEKRKLLKWQKVCIGLVCVFAFISIFCFVAVKMTSADVFDAKFYTKAALALMPEKISTEDELGNKYTFYVEENKEYNEKEDPNNPINAFSFYYFTENEDGTKEKVYIDSEKGNFIAGDGQNLLVSMGFFTGGLNVLRKIQKGLKIAAGISIAGLIVVGIYVWYKDFCRREDERKAEIYGKKNKKIR